MLLHRPKLRWELADDFVPNIWGSMMIHTIIAVKGKHQVMLASAGSPQEPNYPADLRRARADAAIKLAALNEESDHGE